MSDQYEILALISFSVILPITFQLKSHSCTGSDNDFTQAVPFMATFSVGATDNSTVNVTVMILNDTFVERPETFDLSISNVTSTVMASVGNNDSVPITITDNNSEK